MSDAAALLCRRFFCRHIRHSFHCLSLPFRASVLTLSRGNTMKKSVLMFSLLSGTALMFPRLTIASGLPTHTHPNRSPPFSLNNPTKPLRPPPSVSSAPKTAATPASDPWAETTAIKSIPCNNAETRDIPSLHVPSPLILPDNVHITPPILQNVSKTVPAPAKKQALPKLPALPARSWRQLVPLTPITKNANATLVPDMTIPMRRQQLRALFPTGAA